MWARASQITSLTIVYSTVYSGADQRKHQSSTSLAFVRGIHRWSVNSPHKWPVTRKLFSFDDVIMSHYLRTAYNIGYPPPETHLQCKLHDISLMWNLCLIFLSFRNFEQSTALTNTDSKTVNIAGSMFTGKLHTIWWCKSVCKSLLIICHHTQIYVQISFWTISMWHVVHNVALVIW